MISSAAMSETCAELLTTITDAMVPGHTRNCPLLPPGVGTVKVIAVSLQEFTVNAAVLPGAPQLVPRSVKAT